MPYNPGVVDISGQLYAQGMERGQQYLNKGINQFFRTQEEETSFEAKNKAMLAMLTANKEQFGFKDDESLKQFLKGSTFESQRDKYARMGTLVENNIMMAKKAQAEADAKSQNDLRAAQVAQANAHARVFGAQANALENPVLEPSMTEGQFQDFRAKNPTLTVSGNPVNGRYFNVKVTDKEGKPLTVTDLGDRIVYTDPLTGAIVKTENKGAAPSVVPFGQKVLGGGATATGSTALPSVPPLPVQLGNINLEQFNRPPPSMAPAGLSSFIAPSAASPLVNASAGLGRQTNRPPVTASPSPVTTGQGISNIPGGPQDLAEQKKRAEETAAYDTSLNQAIVQIKAIDDALPLINKYTTGIVGSINPTQDRQTLEASLKPIQALTAFQGLSALKKGGVSLGQIAAFEIDALTKIQGNISDLKQDPKVLIKNLESVKANAELIIALHDKREMLITKGKTPIQIEKELRAFTAENRPDPNKIVIWKAIHPEDKSLSDNDILNKDYIFTAQKNGKTPVLHYANGILFRGPAPVTTQGKSPSQIQQEMGSPAPFVTPSVPVNASTSAVDKDYTSSGASFGEARRPITPMDPSEEYNSRRFRPSDSGAPSLTAFPPAPDSAISKEQSAKALPAPLTLSPETAKDMRKILDDYENTQRKQRGETPTFQITGSDGKKRTINLKDGEVADKIIAILTGNSPTDLRPELEIDREATRLRTDEIMRRELLLRQFQRLAPRGR
jgi:hypothetical protein